MEVNRRRSVVETAISREAGEGGGYGVRCGGAKRQRGEGAMQVQSKVQSPYTTTKDFPTTQPGIDQAPPKRLPLQFHRSLETGEGGNGWGGKRTRRTRSTKFGREVALPLKTHACQGFHQDPCSYRPDRRLGDMAGCIRNCQVPPAAVRLMISGALMFFL